MSSSVRPLRLVVGMSGASGAIYGIRIMEKVANCSMVEAHLVMSKGAIMTIQEETNYSVKQVSALADVVHSWSQIGASIASGSFQTEGMIIAPCSMRTVGAIANSLADNLLVRAADVSLKEGRPLVLMTRETPLHHGHLRLMMQAIEAGAVIAPPVPAFYHRPASLEEVIDHSISRVLDRVVPDLGGAQPWEGMSVSQKQR